MDSSEGVAPIHMPTPEHSRECIESGRRDGRALSEPVVPVTGSIPDEDDRKLSSSTRASVCEPAQPGFSISDNINTPNYARGKLRKLRDRRAAKAEDIPRALSFRTFERDAKTVELSEPVKSPCRSTKDGRGAASSKDRTAASVARGTLSSAFSRNSDRSDGQAASSSDRGTPTRRGSSRRFSKEPADSKDSKDPKDAKVRRKPSWVQSAEPVVASIVSPLQHALSPQPGEELTTIGVSLTLNKQLRRKLYLQSYWSNRFTGSKAAMRVEAEYQAFVTQYQLHKVRRRLVGFVVCLLIATLPQGVHKDQVFPHMILRTIVPAVLLSSAAGLCAWWRTRRWWRQVVMSTSIFAYNSILWADATDELSTWSSCMKDYNTMWQIVWLLFVFIAVSLFFALDMIQLAIVLLSLWFSYLWGAITIYGMWYEASGQTWSWSLCDDDGTMLKLKDEDGEAVDEKCHSRILLEVLALSFCALVFMLLAVRRLNRFERQSFVNSYVLTNRVEQQVAQIERKQVELLALFSNPRVPMHAPVQLRPLQLGQELKYLLRSLGLHVVVEPAASLLDVERAVEAHDPRIIHFSGHSWMGSLAFESADGRIEVPQPGLFIEKIRAHSAPRLQCVFLNGCETAELGYAIVKQLPYVTVVCWATITEDAAARAFAQGFYDAVGYDLMYGEPVQVEIAYWSGLERYYADGFRIGDPKAYLHPPGHPHIFNPDFHNCEGCCPPVHGNVVCLRNFDGEVKVLREEERPAGGHNSSMLGAASSCDTLGTEASTGTWVKVSLRDLVPNSITAPPAEPSPPPNQGILSSLRSKTNTRVRLRPREKADGELSSGIVCNAKDLLSARSGRVLSHSKKSNADVQSQASAQSVQRSSGSSRGGCSTAPARPALSKGASADLSASATSPRAPSTGSSKGRWAALVCAPCSATTAVSGQSLADSAVVAVKVSSAPPHEAREAAPADAADISRAAELAANSEIVGGEIAPEI